MGRGPTILAAFGADNCPLLIPSEKAVCVPCKPPVWGCMGAEAN